MSDEDWERSREIVEEMQILRDRLEKLGAEYADILRRTIESFPAEERYAH